METSDNAIKLLILAHIAATLILVGLIWMVQIVHYPLFNRVGADTFRDYQIAHAAKITALVMPLMLIEALTALLLALDPPTTVPPLLLWIGLALVVLIWASTLFIQSPYHTQLSTDFNPAIHQALVCTNWIRTIAWSVHGGIIVWVISIYLDISQ